MDMVDEMGNQLFLVVWMGWEEMHGDGCYQGFLLVQGLGFLGFGVLGFGPETTLEQGGVCWYGWQEEEGQVL